MVVGKKRTKRDISPFFEVFLEGVNCGGKKTADLIQPYPGLSV